MIKKKRQKIRKAKLKRKAKRKKQNKNGLVLAYHDHLEPFLSAIESDNKPQDISLYRWVHQPYIEDDFKPQIFQESNPNSPDTLKRPQEGAPKEVIDEYTKWFTLSHFITEQDAINEWHRNLNKNLSKAKSPEKRQGAINKWITSKGDYIAKINYTKDCGLIGPSEDAVHKQVYIYSGVDVVSLIDKDYIPIKIDSYDAP